MRLNGFDIEMEKNFNGGHGYELITVGDFIKQNSLTEDDIRKISRLQLSVNVHYMLAMETYEAAFQLIDEIADEIPNLNAIVFLQYKPKGSGIGQFHSIQSVALYKRLIEYCVNKNIGFGFDSCSAPLFMKAAMELGKTKWLQYADPCESSNFSAYLNVNGEFFPCSFCEGVKGWEEGISVFEYDSFDKIWQHPRVIEWRKNLLNSSNCSGCNVQGCRSCPVYDLAPCKLPFVNSHGKLEKKEKS